MDKHEPPFVDIKRPSQNVQLGEIIAPETNAATSAPLSDSRSGSSKKLILFFLICVLIAGVSVWGIRSFFEWKRAVQSLPLVSSDFEQGAERLKALNISGALEKFAGAKTSIIIPASIPEFIIGGAIPALRNGEEALKGFSSLVSDYLTLSEEISEIYRVWPDIFSGKISVLPYLNKLSGKFHDLRDNTGVLASALSSIGNGIADDSGSYLGMQADLGRVSSFVDNLLAWLKSNRHVLLVFEDPSIMRATGGKIIAYADVYVSGGKIVSAKVHDASDADRIFAAKLIPPQPLQFRSARWLPSDANWFFDFSDSASKLISMLEVQNTSGTDVAYDAAIAVSPKVFADMLDISGPVSVDGTEVSSSSLGLALEKKAEWGKNGDLAGFLTALWDSIGNDQSLRDNVENASVKILGDLKSKDIMVYFKNRELEGFMDYAGSSGKVEELSKDFYGDYLAVVDSSVGDGRTDRAIKESVSLKSQIDVDGNVTDHLTINRLDKGGEVSWRNNANIDYLRILLPPAAQVDSYAGGDRRSFAERKYDMLTYAADPELLSWEQSFHNEIGVKDAEVFTESGKKGLAGWSILYPGESEKITLDYHSKLPLSPTDGVKYQMILETQPGRSDDYNFEIDAPVGFRFAESKLPVYDYQISNPPGRITLNLTLEPISKNP